MVNNTVSDLDEIIAFVDSCFPSTPIVVMMTCLS
jgi:hypothetical protein